MERRLTSNSQFTLSETSETSQPEETLNMIADMREQLQLWQQGIDSGIIFSQSCSHDLP
jgi:hypothetical protein